ncbi:capsid cement protein [Sinomonas sp. ASV322]|uniref:capsid cement protein n=1 Tax=Sinomonas sp. ASV322 TaxID=3041920 RepID=UPI0027DC4E15|nr:capsid cement protein [Sinomonas sp. ASV322]MDQ4502176.1 DUF2190 family protein [Sinomonas sp. ASV322]
MSTHIHLFDPGATVTFTAAADVAAGQLLAVAGNRSVSPAAAKSAAWIGAAAFDAKAGEKVAVLRGGVQRLTASGTVAAGTLVVAAAGGKVAALAPVTTPTPADVADTRAVVGIALTGGTDVPVEIALDR